MDPDEYTRKIEMDDNNSWEVEQIQAEIS